jgi:kynurenine formamidase
MTVLADFIAALDRGTLKVVDLTQPLGPDTPVIGLPPMFAPSPGVSMEVISRYDEKGPAWYWNTITMGEHTGTHFDAPIHWISGKDLPNNAVDTIDVRKFIAPACVLDCSAACANNPDFALTIPFVEEWEARHGKIEPGSWVLLRTDWSKKTYPEYAGLRDDGAHLEGRIEALPARHDHHPPLCRRQEADSRIETRRPRRRRHPAFRESHVGVVQA